MKRFLVGAVLAVASSPAFAQVQTDYRPLCYGGAVNEEGDVDVICPERLNSDGDIIVVGTRIGTSNLSELTAPASVLTENEITARSQSYIADLLRSLPGISVNSSGPAGGLTQIRMRGTEASHVLVLIDGIEVANPTAGEFDFAGLRAEDIVRIETLRGEQSALYGSDAVGGVINIITRAGETRESYRASVEGGTNNTLEGQISAVVPLGDAALSINGNAFTTDGYDISGQGGERDGSKSRSLNVGLNNVDFGRVVLNAKGSTSRLDVDFDEDSPFDGVLDNTDGRSIVKTKTGRIDARFGLIGFDHLITLSALETETDSRGSFPSLSTGKRNNLNWAAEREFGNHSLTILAELETETYKLPTLEVDNQNKTLAADYRYSDGALTLTGSIRQDFNDRFDDALTWRAGAGYAIENIGGRLRASVGTGVKNPSLIELFGFTPGSNFIPNPNLKPEESLGYSLGYEHKLSNLSVSVDYFHSDLENEVFTTFTPPTFAASPSNRMTDSKREGVELEARWNNDGPVSARASATFLDTEENNIKEIRRPEFLASGTLSWNATDALSLTTSIDHTGSQMDRDFATFSDVKLDAFTLVGLNASYDVNNVVTVSLRGENLLDENYQEVVGYASPGRRIFVGLRASFD